MSSVGFNKKYQKMKNIFYQNALAAMLDA